MTSAVALAVLSAMAQDSIAPTSVPGARRAERVAILPVEGPIDSVTVRSLSRRLDRAKADGVDAIVIALDTPGGETGATLDICRLIKTEMPPNTVAWIRPTAYSAGTLIALAAREIVVTPDAVFGTSAPIAAIPGVGLVELPPAERAKLEGPLLSEVIDSARRNRYDERLVQAFVAVGIELWMLEDEHTGERVFVDRSEYRAVFGEEPPEWMPSAAPSPTLPAIDRRPVRPFFSDLFTAPARRGKATTTPSPEVQAAQIEFEQTRPSARPRLDASERGRWKLVAQIDAPDRLLTVRANEAMAFGLASEQIADEQALARFLGATRVQTYDESWSESLVRFLMSWPVRLILVAVMVICFLVELAIPGFGAFGIASLICLVALIGTPALLGLAQWWQVALAAVGAMLVVAELVVFPGTIVVGLSGAVLVLVGVAGAFVQNELNTAAGQRELLLAIVGTLVTATVAAVVGGTILRRLGGPRLMRLAILDAEIGGNTMAPAAVGSAGSVVIPIDGEPGDDPSGTVARARRVPAVGARGVAHTDLRPAGKGTFDGTIYDVRSVEGYLDRGHSIRIVRATPAELDVESDDA